MGLCKDQMYADSSVLCCVQVFLITSCNVKKRFLWKENYWYNIWFLINNFPVLFSPWTHLICLRLSQCKSFEIIVILRQEPISVTSNRRGSDNGPVAKMSFGSWEMKAGNSIGLGGIEDRSSKVRCSGIINMAQRIGVFSLQHSAPSTCASGVPNITVLVHWFG